MVTAAASTGMTAMSRNAVMSQVQTNSGICIQPMPGARRLKMVTMTLMAPMMGDPHDVNGKDEQGRAVAAVLGGQGGIEGPARTGAASSINRLDRRMRKANGRIQKLQLFMGQRHVRGPNHDGDQPVGEAGEGRHDGTKDHDKAVYRGHLVENRAGSTSCSPGWNSSARITMAMAPPVKNMVRAKHRYRVPMSL